MCWKILGPAWAQEQSDIISIGRYWKAPNLQVAIGNHPQQVSRSFGYDPHMFPKYVLESSKVSSRTKRLLLLTANLQKLDVSQLQLSWVGCAGKCWAQHGPKSSLINSISSHFNWKILEGIKSASSYWKSPTTSFATFRILAHVSCMPWKAPKFHQQNDC